MSIAHAFFCVVWFVGLGAILWFGIECYLHCSHHRYQRGWRHWPREQHRSYFSDCRRMYPDEF